MNTSTSMPSPFSNRWSHTSLKSRQPIRRARERTYSLCKRCGSAASESTCTAGRSSPGSAERRARTISAYSRSMKRSRVPAARPARARRVPASSRRRGSRRRSAAGRRPAPFFAAGEPAATIDEAGIEGDGANAALVNEKVDERRERRGALDEDGGGAAASRSSGAGGRRRPASGGGWGRRADAGRAASAAGRTRIGRGRGRTRIDPIDCDVLAPEGRRCRARGFTHWYLHKWFRGRSVPLVPKQEFGNKGKSATPELVEIPMGFTLVLTHIVVSLVGRWSG